MISTTRRARYATGRRTAAVVIACALALQGASAVAQEQDQVVITAPQAEARLSLALDDADPGQAGFQLEIEGEATEDSEVTVEARRPGQGFEVLDTTDADDGEWAVEATLDAGEWLLRARASIEGQDESVSPEVRIFIVVRYLFTWYDDDHSAGNWILVANPGDANARAEVVVEGERRGGTLNVGAGEAAFPRFAGLLGGPVEVNSLDGVPLVVTQRVTWRSGSLEEVAGVFDGYLAETSWLSWYDTENTGGRDWIVVTNFGDDDAEVEVTVDGETLDEEQEIPPGASGVFHEPGVVGGPVEVSADQPVLASRRTLWRPGTFTEITSVPDAWLERQNYFTWYDDRNATANWILLANPTSDDAEVQIHLRDPQTLEEEVFEVEVAAGEIETPRFRGEVGGPVFVDSDVPILATQRSLWSQGSSFEEVGSVPSAGITSVYWQSWYDRQRRTGDSWARGEWMLQANIFPPEDDQAPGVPYVIEGPSISHSSDVGPGEIETPQFPGRKEGPLEVRSTAGFGFLHSKRTLWGPGLDFMELPGIRGTTRTMGPQNPATLAVQLPAPEDVDVSAEDGSARVEWSQIDHPTVDGYWVYRSALGQTERRMGFVPEAACADGTCVFLDPTADTTRSYTYSVVGLSLGLVEGVAGQDSGPGLLLPPT